MNIKTRLSVQFSIIAVGILIFFSILVYYFSYTSQLNKFRENLLDSAKNTAILLINVTEVDSSLLKKIHQSTISWEREEISLTDSALKVIYSNNIKYLSSSIMKINASLNGIEFFTIKEKDGVCYKHFYRDRTYYVFVMAYDKSRKEYLSELIEILLWSILFSLWLSVLLSYFFSRKAIQPISNIVKSVKEINSQKLGNRLNEGKRKDEIDQLAITFNELLQNLESAFKNQEEFISHASHELRTPLSVIISESDYILSRDRTNEEYIKHISAEVNDLKKINALLNSLLELAQINKNVSIAFSEIRIDEILYDAVRLVKTKFQNHRIVPKINYPENSNDLLISGNAGLLTIAFRNLIENACKFSGEDVIVEFLINSRDIVVLISDKGIGIPQNELNSIMRPFNRASNAKYIGGFGIGLSLVVKIMEIHNAKFQIRSSINEGTVVELDFIRI